MSYSKQKVNNLASKIKGCADELDYLVQRVKFESGDGGATDRALHAAREMKDEIDRIAELRAELITQIEAGMKQLEEA